MRPMIDPDAAEGCDTALTMEAANRILLPVNRSEQPAQNSKQQSKQDGRSVVYKDIESIN